jgi:hypothetical protein
MKSNIIAVGCDVTVSLSDKVYEHLWSWNESSDKQQHDPVWSLQSRDWRCYVILRLHWPASLWMNYSKYSIYAVCFIFPHYITSRVEQLMSGQLEMIWKLGSGSFPGNTRFFLLFTKFKLIVSLGPTQSPIQWVPWALSLGVKRQGREADHSPPSSAEVKKGGAIPSLPHMSSWHSA